MDENQSLAKDFEAHRAHLTGVAFRMLGSSSEADDAVQEAWLRLSRSDSSEVRNLGGWLTTVVSRLCLDMLRSRKARREEPLEAAPGTGRLPDGENGAGGDPERDALLADSVGIALLVVLERLAPAERVAFVLHDLFGLSFDEIAAVVGRSPAAARQLASRARRRVHGAGAATPGPRGAAVDVAGQRRLVDAFLAAQRSGDLEALLAVLDPDVVVRVHGAAPAQGVPAEIRGAQESARQALRFARGARGARPALVDGAAGLVVAPGGRLSRAIRFSFADGRITAIEIMADADSLRHVDIALLDA